MSDFDQNPKSPSGLPSSKASSEKKQGAESSTSSFAKMSSLPGSKEAAEAAAGFSQKRSSADASKPSSNESMDLVRKRRERMKNHKPTTAPRIPLAKKIAGISIVFAFVVVGYWTFKKDDYLLGDGELPVITAESSISDGADFKVPPTEEDIIASPHSDKQFYSELDQSKPNQTNAVKAGGLRALPEDPSQQVSQEKMMAQAEQDLSKEANAGESMTVASTQKGDDNPVQAEAAKDVVVAVVDEPKAQEARKVSKPRKTLEMAIQETQNKVKQESQVLSYQKNVTKHKVRTANDHLDIVRDDSLTTAAKTSNTGAGKPKTIQVKSADNAKKTVRVHYNKVPEGMKATAKAPVRSAAPKSSPKAGSYYIQVASLANEGAAASEAKRIENKAAGDLSAANRRTVRVDLGQPKGIKYRVQYGPYAKQNAVDACKSLKGKSGIGCFVIRG